jgi:precorrin-6B methylase 2
MQRQNFPGNPNSPQFQHRGGGFFVPPPHFVRPRPFFFGAAPFHLHRNWFFRRHPGFVFFDVPYFADSGTVITQVAPGIIRADRGQTEESPGDEQTRGPGQLAPFDPTPQDVVERMLTLAAVKKGDVIYDLGAGDGRILITAARKYGVRGVGYEIDAGLAKLARENVRKQGVERLVEIRQEDFLGADLSPASVVALYLSQDGNLAVRQLLMNQLKTGARVVSYTFDMGEWVPKIAESYRDANGDAHLIYLWQIGEPPLFSNVSSQMLQPQASRRGPLIIDVK